MLLSVNRNVVLLSINIWSCDIIARSHISITMINQNTVCWPKVSVKSVQIPPFLNILFTDLYCIGSVVKVVDSHLCGWGLIPGKSCSFFIVSLSKGFMCSDHKLNLITKLNQELITALHMLSKSGCLVGFPCLAICCWITTLNNTYTHTIPDSPLRISKLPLFFTEKMRKKYVNLKSFRRLHRTKLQGGRIVQW